MPAGGAVLGVTPVFERVRVIIMLLLDGDCVEAAVLNRVLLSILRLCRCAWAALPAPMLDRGTLFLLLPGVLPVEVCC